MYVIDPAVKADPARRWNLPDRVFFAAGACHLLAYAFMRRYPAYGYRPIWIKPDAGYIGNHIVAVRGQRAFDYHGHSDWNRLVGHIQAKANRWWPGWRAELVELPTEVLISESKSRTYQGLWLREPRQFLHDALPRADRFVDRFPLPQDPGRVDGGFEVAA
jgi:hypothetical protein